METAANESKELCGQVEKKKQSQNLHFLPSSSSSPSPFALLSPLRVDVLRRRGLPTEVHLVRKIIPVSPRVAAKAQALEG